ncbi:2,4-dihydroxyhept-2-ene-1,7-dioic acid aldolase [Escherichia coli]|nr:2,4-dihydroxyhept-2-ene-1,7-dioic acid aldolase [Escherichia coli]
MPVIRSTPEVQAAIEQAIVQIREAGKAPGILIANEQLAKRYLELGALFVAVGVDTTLLARAAEALAARFWCSGHRREARRVLMPDALRLSGLHSHQTVGRIRRLRRHPANSNTKP